MIRLAVFGNPISQSLSPRIHTGFARQLGLAVDYQAIRATEEDFEDQVRDLAQAGAAGCNITLPFKHQAYALASSHSENARRAGAANTLVFGQDWYADNTDGRGLVKDLATLGYETLEGMHIGILGAGGATCGALAALLMAGPRQVIIANRTAEKAKHLAHSHADLGRVMGCAPQDLAGVEPFDLLINATSTGHQGTIPELAPDWLAQGGLLYDLNYGAASMPLREWSRQHGVAYADGLGMLVGQAAESFELWTGQAPDRAPVLAELRTEFPG